MGCSGGTNTERGLGAGLGDTGGRDGQTSGHVAVAGRL